MCGTCKCSRDSTRTAAALVVVAVCGLLVWVSALVPTFLYAQSIIERSSHELPSVSCPQMSYNRSSSPCYSILAGFQGCQTPIPINVTHASQSNNAKEAIVLLFKNLLDSSIECKAAFLPFMCHYLFPICDESNSTVFLPSYQDCTYISTNVCKVEWQEAIVYGLDSLLPSCTKLPDNPSCPSTLREIVPSQTRNNSTAIDCTEDFLFINGTCKPRCGRWATLTGRIIQTFLVSFGVLGILLQISYFVFNTANYKTILMLPKLFIILMNADVAIIKIMILFNSIHPKVLVCSTSDLFENPDSPSVYCSISGAVLQFALSQLSITWLVCNSLFLWILKKPFTARSLQNTNWNKYIHAAILALCFAVPVIPVSITLALDGFTAVGFPPLLCTPMDSQLAYFSTILPIGVTNAIGSSILTYMLWIVFKHYRAVQKNSLNKQKIPKAIQKSMVAVFCISLAMSACFLISLAASSLGAKQLAFNVRSYFLCSDSGSDIDNTCKSFKNSAESSIDIAVVALPYLCMPIFSGVHVMKVIRRQDVVTFKNCYKHCTKIKDYKTNQQSQINLAQLPVANI